MNNKTILHISLIKGIGPGCVAQIHAVVPYADFDQLYRWSIQDFMYKARLSERQAHALCQGLFDKAILDTELRLIEKHAVQWVAIGDRDYPELLKEIPYPPLVLYWRGCRLKLFDRSIAVVGSRKSNNYGQEAINTIVHDLAHNNWAIVSGGALGADTMAHRAALECDIPTVAVIGSGLLKPYPACNKRLFESIIERGGALLSPFHLTMDALPGNFPARNRIIAGMSCATVVIQAAEKSGARITALYALDQGREVCAVPGPINDPLSVGCHKLIKEGAALVTSGLEVLEACGFQIMSEQKIKSPLIADTCDTFPVALSRDPLVELCKIPHNFDDLLEKLSYDFAQLHDRLLTLQLEGVLNQDLMGRWYVCQ